MKKKKEFSKVLLIQESILIWISTIAVLILSYICILNDYSSNIPWLVTLITAIWGAYGVSAGFYYNKAKKENI